jgi:parallel beta-helix repeat protein
MGGWSHQVASNNAEVFIDNNILTNNIFAGGWGEAAGIDVLNCNSPITITNNIITGSQGMGIRLGGGYGKITIRGNTIGQGTSWGIAIGGSNNSTVQNNIIESNSSGISIDSGTGLSVLDNTVRNNTNRGISLGGGSGSLSNNTISGNGAYGIYAANANWTIHNNNLYNNTSYDLYYAGGAGTTLDATDNWWGTINGAEIGKHIYDSKDDLTKGTVNIATVLTGAGGQSNKVPTVSANAVPFFGNIPFQPALNGTASDTDGSIVNYEWDFDGDGVFDWSSTATGNTTYTYTTAGNYTAVFQATDNRGFQNQVAVNVTALSPGSGIEVKLEGDITSDLILPVVRTKTR